MNNGQLKVLHIIPPVKFGGGESILHNLVLMGLERGNDESICCLYRSTEFERVLNESNIRWVCLSKIGLGSGPARIISKIYAIALIFKVPRLLKALARSEPDVIHLHGFPSNFIGFLLKKLGKISGNHVPPMVYTHHAESGIKGLIENRIFDYIYREMDFVTAVSLPSLNSLLKDHAFLSKKSLVIQNFASPKFYEVGMRRVPKDFNGSPRTRFINVARFTPLKNQRAIIDAVNQLSVSERARIMITFVGDGETLPEVKAAVIDAKLSGCFEFMGFVPNEQVAELLARSDVMIFPSQNEGSPIAVAEALAAGLPVIGLECCKPVVQIAADAGVFVSGDKLADGIRIMLSADLSVLSKRALVRSNLFDPIKAKHLYLNVYKHVLDACEIELNGGRT